MDIKQSKWPKSAFALACFTVSSNIASSLLVVCSAGVNASHAALLVGDNAVIILSRYVFSNTEAFSFLQQHHKQLDIRHPMHYYKLSLQILLRHKKNYKHLSPFSNQQLVLQLLYLLPLLQKFQAQLYLFKFFFSIFGCLFFFCQSQLIPFNSIFVYRIFT